MHFSKPDPSRALSHEANIQRLVEVERGRRAAEERRRERKKKAGPTKRSGAMDRLRPCRDCGTLTKRQERRRNRCVACYHRDRRAKIKAGTWLE